MHHTWSTAPSGAGEHNCSTQEKMEVHKSCMVQVLTLLLALICEDTQSPSLHASVELSLAHETGSSRSVAVRCCPCDSRIKRCEGHVCGSTVSITIIEALSTE